MWFGKDNVGWLMPQFAVAMRWMVPDEEFGERIISGSSEDELL